MNTLKPIVEHKLYAIEHHADANLLLHKWHNEAGSNLPEFKKGVATFASQCKILKPAHAVFDASPLDPNGIVVGWISGRNTPEGEEAYGPWWMREIVSIYNDIGLKSLSIASGDPNASGEQASSPPGCDFAIGFFTDLPAAVAWRPK